MTPDLLLRIGGVVISLLGVGIAAYFLRRPDLLQRALSVYPTELVIGGFLLVISILTSLVVGGVILVLFSIGVL